MNFKGTVSVRGDNGDPLPIDINVTDTRLTLKTRDGSVIGDWPIDGLSVSQTSEGVVVQVDGEKLTLAVRKPEALAESLRATSTSGVAHRISEARQSPNDTERVRPLLAVALLAGLLGVFGIGLWAAGMPPFDRTSPERITVISRTPTLPTQTVTTPRRVTTTTKTLSTLEQADAFWTTHLGFWQGNPSVEGGNVLGYLDRAIDASHSRQWGVMGAECAAAQPIAEAAAFTAMLAPTTEIEHLETAFWEEIQEALFWCATGNDTAADFVNPSIGVAMALVDRVENALRELGYNITENG